MENGKFTVTTHQAKAQTYGAEYTCEDNDGKPISQSIPCDEGPCVHGCPTCHGSYPCDSPHQCPAISHNGEGLPDNGSGSGNGSSGSGNSGGGSGGTSGGSSGSSSGGSGSSGGGGNEMVFSGLIYNYASPQKFYGYRTIDGCLINCYNTMNNYSQKSHGSSAKTIKLIDINGTYYGNSKAVYNEIVRHLKAGKLIIAGVDYKPSSPDSNKDGVTDHFILISGMGYDASKGQEYFTYMETGRTLQNAIDACDTNTNRLYFNQNKGFEGDRWDKKKHYKLTHIRPNF